MQNLVSTQDNPENRRTLRKELKKNQYDLEELIENMKRCIRSGKFGFLRVIVTHIGVISTAFYRYLIEYAESERENATPVIDLLDEFYEDDVEEYMPSAAAAAAGISEKEATTDGQKIYLQKIKVERMKKEDEIEKEREQEAKRLRKIEEEAEARRRNKARFSPVSSRTNSPERWSRAETLDENQKAQNLAFSTKRDHSFARSIHEKSIAEQLESKLTPEEKQIKEDEELARKLSMQLNGVTTYKGNGVSWRLPNTTQIRRQAPLSNQKRAMSDDDEERPTVSDDDQETPRRSPQRPMRVQPGYMQKAYEMQKVEAASSVQRKAQAASSVQRKAQAASSAQEKQDEPEEYPVKISTDEPEEEYPVKIATNKPGATLHRLYTKIGQGTTPSEQAKARNLASKFSGKRPQ